MDIFVFKILNGKINLHIQQSQYVLYFDIIVPINIFEINVYFHNQNYSITWLN